MKKKLTNNLGFKILSVVLAILLWLIVVNVSDPEKTTTITNIPITVLNEEAVTGQEKVYEIISGRTATVEVTGPRTIIDSLEASSFRATADLSKLSMTNAVEIDVELVTVSYRSKVDIDVQTTMKIQIENLVNKEFTAEVSDRGTVADGFVIYNRTMAEDLVEVTAPESVMDTIAKVGVSVNVSGAYEDFTVTEKFQAYDNRGNVIDAESNNISFSIQETEIKVTVYPVKQIAIIYEIDETDYPNTIFSSITISRDHIMIAGKSEGLAAINELVLDTSMLQVTQNNSSYELRYDINELLPDGVYVYGDDNSITIKVETDAIITRTFTVPVNDIGIKSLGEGYSAAHETTGTIAYVLRGRKSVLEQLSTEDNSLFVSTKDLAEGEYNLAVQMDLEDGIELVQPVYVRVKITEKDKPTESTTPGNTSTGEDTSSENESSSEEEKTTDNQAGVGTEDNSDVPVDGGVSE